MLAGLLTARTCVGSATEIEATLAAAGSTGDHLLPPSAVRKMPAPAASPTVALENAIAVGVPDGAPARPQVRPPSMVRRIVPSASSR
jgi:hypothetical protein